MVLRLLMQIISGIFHPLLLTTYSCVLLYVIMPDLYSPIPQSIVPLFVGSIFVLTFLIPALSILLLKGVRVLSNLEMTQREERVLPFFLIAAFYGVTTYLFHTKMNLPNPLFMIMVVVTALIFLLFIISTRFKISIHSAGIWGVSGIFSALFMKYLGAEQLVVLSGLFLTAGLVTTSRLYLGRHSTLESWVGVGTGFVVCFTGVYLFL